MLRPKEARNIHSATEECEEEEEEEEIDLENRCCSKTKHIMEFFATRFETKKDCYISRQSTQIYTNKYRRPKSRETFYWIIEIR